MTARDRHYRFTSQSAMDQRSRKRGLAHSGLDGELQEKRAGLDLDLKLRFEAIFEKFGKDFSGEGDEIDLETGEIVVDNGHIAHMMHEQDLGHAFDPPGRKLSASGVSDGGSLMNREVACSDVERAAHNFETESEGMVSDLLESLSSRESRELWHQRSTTILRNADTDNVWTHRSRMGRLSSPTEPAWKVPRLAKDKKKHQPLMTSQWRRERRPESPDSSSLWKAPRCHGPAKNEAAVTARQNKILSMPAISREKPSSDPRMSANKTSGAVCTPGPRSNQYPLVVVEKYHVRQNDLEKDELAIPVNDGEKTNSLKTLKRSNKSAACPKLQSCHGDSESEDELSTSVKVRLVQRFREKAEKRGKES